MTFYHYTTEWVASAYTGAVTGAVTGNASTATALAADPANCAAGSIALGVTAAGVAECTATPTGLTSVAATTFTGALTGNASTASALASNPSDCEAGQYATAIAANGNLTCGSPAGTGDMLASIYDANSDNVVDSAATAAALAADPADCSAGQVATGIAASGALTCTATPSVTTLTGAVTGNASTASALAADPADCSAGQVATGIAASGALSCTATPTLTTVTAGSFISNATDGERQFGSVNTNDNTVALTEGYIYYNTTANLWKGNQNGSVINFVTEGTGTGGLIFGDTAPADAAGEIVYDSNKISFHDGTAARTLVAEAVATGGVLLGDASPDAAGEVGYSTG